MQSKQVKEPQQVIEEAYRKALEQRVPAAATIPIVVERPRQAGHGDWSTSVALQAAKSAGKKPRQLAEELSAAADEIIFKIDPNLFEKAEIAGPGFINYRLK